MEEPANIHETNGRSVTVGLPDFLDTPENRGALAALQAKSELQGAALFFDDPIHVRRDLMHKGAAAGWHTPTGHTISNIIQGLENMRDYVRPPWAKDVRQTLPYLISKQVERLERLSG